MICVSIIHRVRIISIANISGAFMISDILSLLKTYQIVNDNSVMSDKYIYLYCHLYKVPTAPCAQDITLNHFAYLEVIKKLPTDSICQIYYGYRRKIAHCVKIKYLSSRPSSSDGLFSLMVSPLSVPSQQNNQFCHIISPYSMIVSESSNVKDISDKKKQKLIINSNESFFKEKE